MTRVRAANDANHALPANDPAVLAKSLYGCAYFHLTFSLLFIFKNQHAVAEISRRYFQTHFVPGMDTRHFFPLLERNPGKQPMAVGQFHQKSRRGAMLPHDASGLDGRLSGHVKISGSPSVTRMVCSK